MTNQTQKFYYYGVLKSTNRHGFSEDETDFNGPVKTLTETEMSPFINQAPDKHIEWDDDGNPIIVPYNTQYWGEHDTDGRLLRFAGYRFSENCIRIEKPDWGE